MAENTKKAVAESRRSSTIWNFFFLNFGFIISIINGVLIIPLYLHYIDSKIYGSWLATGNILSWITMVDPGVSGVLLQRISFARGKGDHKGIGLAIASGISISSLLFTLAVAIGYGFSFYICQLAKIDVKYQDLIVRSFRIALWGTAFSLLADTFRNVVLAFQKTKLHGIFLNTVLLSSIVVNVVLLYFGYGIYALALTSLFRGAMTLIMAVFFSFFVLRQNNIKLHFQQAYFKSFSKIFAFTFSSRLFETIASNIDLILVSRYIGPGAVTILDLSRRPLKLCISNVNSVTQAMLPSLPHLFGSGDDRKIRSTVVQIINVVLWSSSLIVGGFILFNHSFIHNWVGNAFWIGNTNNILLCTTALLLTLGYNLSNITYSKGDLKDNSVINVVRSVVYIVLLFLLGKLFGMIGIILASLLSVSIMAIYYPFKVFTEILLEEDRKVILSEVKVVLLIILSCIAGSYIVTNSFLWTKFIGFACLYLILFVSLLYFLSKEFKKVFGHGFRAITKQR